MSFTYNPEAIPFCPRKDNESGSQNSLQARVNELELQLREEKIRNAKLQNVSPEKCCLHRALQLSIREKDKTIEDLNRRIRSVTTNNLSIKCEIRDAREKIEEQEIEKGKFLDQLKDKDEEIRQHKITIKYRVEDIHHERNLAFNWKITSQKWMGRCLRLDYIFKQLRKISALPEDHGEWVYDMVDSIEFPDNPSESIYDSIPLFIREENLPHYGDAHMEPADREDEIELIESLTREAHEHSVSVDHSITEEEELKILKIKSSVKIQAAWRGYKSRVIITYDGHIPEYQNANMILNNDSVPGSYNPRHRNFTSMIDCQGLYFFNTSNQPLSYQWIVPNNIIGRTYTLRPREHIRIATYYGHWFRVWPGTVWGSSYFFRITPNSRYPNTRQINLSERLYFDLNTRITIDYDTFISTNSLRRPRLPLSFKFYKSIITNEDDSDDTRLQMAIQLSLEGVNNPLTIDVEDYNISQLFN